MARERQNNREKTLVSNKETTGHLHTHTRASLWRVRLVGGVNGELAE